MPTRTPPSWAGVTAPLEDRIHELLGDLTRHGLARGHQPQRVADGVGCGFGHHGRGLRVLDTVRACYPFRLGWALGCPAIVPLRDRRATSPDAPTPEDVRVAFADIWGDMGPAWNVTPSVARVHGYLLISGAVRSPNGRSARPSA